MTNITPIQAHNNGTACRDVALTTGVGLLGAGTGAIAGYNLKPTAKQYAKTIINQQLEDIDTYMKVIDDGLANLQTATKKERKIILKMFKAAESGLKKMGVNVKRTKTPEEFAKQFKDILAEKVKDITSPEFKDTLIEQFKSLDNETKNSLKPLFRKGNMIKWGSIGAGAAALMTAYLLCFAKDRNE